MLCRFDEWHFISRPCLPASVRTSQNTHGSSIRHGGTVFRNVVGHGVEFGLRGGAVEEKGHVGHIPADQSRNRCISIAEELSADKVGSRKGVMIKFVGDRWVIGAIGRIVEGVVGVGVGRRRGVDIQNHC